MISLYKLIFDLSVYYTLTGFYMNIFTGTPAFLPGLSLLCLMCGLFLLLKHKKMPNWCAMISFLVPALVLLFKPSLWGLVHMLPAWCYCVWRLYTGRLGTNYDLFRQHFLFGLRVQLVCIFGLILSADGKEALLNSMVPFLLLLAVGVSCLRSLREADTGMRYGLWTGIFLGLCALMTLGGVPNVAMTILTKLYEWIVVPLIQGVGMVLFAIFFGILSLVADYSRVQSGSDKPSTEMKADSVQDILGIQTELVDMSGRVQWLIVFGYITAGLVVIALVVWLLIRLMHNLDVHRVPAVVYSQKEERIKAPPVRRPGLLRPKDARESVRYYYALFLRECRHRGLNLPIGSTAQEITQVCAPCFPGADPKDIAVLYEPARYWETGEVTQQQAKAAAQAWSRLRKTKYKRPESA